LPPGRRTWEMSPFWCPTRRRRRTWRARPQWLMRNANRSFMRALPASVLDALRGSRGTLRPARDCTSRPAKAAGGVSGANFERRGGHGSENHSWLRYCPPIISDPPFCPVHSIRNGRQAAPLGVRGITSKPHVRVTCTRWSRDKTISNRAPRRACRSGNTR
jgi:hypothetical protein